MFLDILPHAVGLEVECLDKNLHEIGHFVVFLDFLPRFVGCWERGQGQNGSKIGQIVGCLHLRPHAMGLKVKDRHHQSCLTWLEWDRQDSLSDCTNSSNLVNKGSALLP